MISYFTNKLYTIHYALVGMYSKNIIVLEVNVLIYIFSGLALYCLYKVYHDFINDKNLIFNIKKEIRAIADIGIVTQPIEFVIFINKFYISNIYKTIINILLYFTVHFFIFFFLRLSFLGESRDYHFLLGKVSFYYQMLPLLCIIVACYIYVIKITNLLLYPSLIRLHIYLQGNDKYVYIEDLYKEHYFGVIQGILSNFASICYRVTLRERQVAGIKFGFSSYKKYIRRLMLLSRKFLRNKPFINKLILSFSIFASTRIYLTYYIFYLPHLTLLITFIYDVYLYGKFYYIYFAGVYFVVANVHEKINQFMYEKDPYHDRQIYEFLYGEQSKYKEIQKLLDNWDLCGRTNEDKLIIGSKIFFGELTNERILSMYDNESLAQYILNDFKIYYAISDGREECFLQRRLLVKRRL